VYEGGAYWDRSPWDRMYIVLLALTKHLGKIIRQNGRRQEAIRCGGQLDGILHELDRGPFELQGRVLHV
jgi:hypothetical protein